VTTAVCPGSFDPVTYGHLDVIERAATLFDEVIIACTRLDNVSVESFEGLLVTFCQERGVPVVVKGLRAVSDFEYELQMAQMNARLGEVETLFMTTSPVYSFLSSSLVKEVARFGGDITDFVPPVVAERLRAQLP
jgi:pantetheine-phosphate adenylyltransferase